MTRAARTNSFACTPRRTSISRIVSRAFSGSAPSSWEAAEPPTNDLATFAGVFRDGATNGPAGGSYYAGVDTTSTGFELEFAGRITDRWTLNGGYSYFTLSDTTGTDPRPYLPHRTVKLSSSFVVLPAYDLRLGGDVHWQNSIYYVDTGVMTADGASGVVRQPSYPTLDLRTSARITDHLHTYLNVHNVTDRKYLASLLWGQAYYAAPRNVTLSADYKF